MNRLFFQKAAAQDAEKVYALYQSLIGTPFCAWDENYPNLGIVKDDIAVGGLYTLTNSTELMAAGTIRHWREHDELACWCSMHRPCDLMRIGVARPFQGRGIGRFFLRSLMAEAKQNRYDFMRILVAKTNVPAIALYRRIGATFHGEAFSYGIEWLCCQIALCSCRHTATSKTTDEFNR